MYLYETPYLTRIHTVNDVKADVFINAYAQHLKKNEHFKLPKWVDYVKTGVSKELGPLDGDWYYIRAASILRHIYIRPDCGVGAFRKIYSCRCRRGSQPNTSKKAAGKIIRSILQQFEELDLVCQKDRGRRLTSKGQKELDTIARQCAETVEE